MKDAFLFSSCLVEIAENHLESHPMIELLQILSSQFHTVSTVKGRALSEEEWGPKSWNVDMWEYLGEAGDFEPLNSDESYLPLEEISPSPKGAAFHSQWK